MLFGKRRPISVTLLVHGPAARFLEPGGYSLRQGDRVRDLLKSAGLRGPVPGLSCLIEGERVEPSQRLQDGQVVTALQMIAGG